ncbi:MAG: hypothetical protein JWR20_1216 [Marmoricola sp.]|nr:hypothetical protein [Marmoricola sp.]
MDGVLKKGAVIIVVLFLGFWLVQDPTGFAGSLKGAGSALWDMLEKLFEALISFAHSVSK